MRKGNRSERFMKEMFNVKNVGKVMEFFMLAEV